MKKCLIHSGTTLLLCSLLSLAALAQAKPAGSSAGPLSKTDLRLLKEKEDSLSEYSRFLVTDSLTEDRMVSDSIFTRALVRSLQVRHSFYYPFDSVLGISKLYAPDSSFRIFTWNIQFDDYYSRQKGAIQLRTADGSLRLRPLQDVSEFTDFPQDSLRDRMHWIGAIYYNIIQTTYQNRNYYTLFGFDPNGVMSSKKWIDVLTFNDRQEPLFGGPFFSFEQDSVRRAPAHRISLEYKKDARVLLNYVPDLNMILADHLISETDEPDNLWTYVPDGDNEAYKWENGKWLHVDKAFDYKVDMQGADPYLGRPPMGDPILDKKENQNQQWEQTEQPNGRPPLPGKAPAKAPVKKKKNG